MKKKSLFKQFVIGMIIYLALVYLIAVIADMLWSDISFQESHESFMEYLKRIFL